MGSEPLPPSSATLGDMAWLAALGRAFGLARTDASGRIVDSSATFCELMHRDADGLKGQPCPLFWQTNGTLPTPAWRAAQQNEVWTGVVFHREGAHRIELELLVVPMESAGGGALLLSRNARPRQHGSNDEALQLIRPMLRALLHEVRTPLAGAQMALDVLHKRFSGSQTAPPTLLNDAQHCLQSLSGTLDALARFCQPRAYRCDIVDLGAVITDLLSDHDARPRWGDVQWTAPPAPCHVRGDAPALRELCTALLDNAADACQHQRPVRIELDIQHAFVQLAMIDGGCGMAADVASQAFEPFFTTKHRRLGLGLAVAQRIARHHDGTLNLVANPQGGTIATLSLPIVDSALPNLADAVRR